MAKLLEAQIHEETKLWNLLVLCLSRLKYARKEQWREENRVKKIEDSSYSLLRTFGVLPKVHFLHAIHHFKSQEVKNPTLQTVYDLELK